MTTVTETRERCGIDLLDALYERRSVRAYTSRKVESPVIRRLLDAAIQAPSAMNSQPWAFAIVQEPALLRRVSERSKQLALASMKPGTPHWEHRAKFEDPNNDLFYGAGTLLVVYALPGAWHVSEDCCLAAQNLLLAAHGLGLGACIIGLARDTLNEPEFRRELNVPADHPAVVPLILGYPNERPAAPPRRPPVIHSWR